MRVETRVRRLGYFCTSHYPQLLQNNCLFRDRLSTLSSPPLTVCQLTGTSAPKETFLPPHGNDGGLQYVLKALERWWLPFESLPDRSVIFDPNYVEYPQLFGCLSLKPLSSLALSFPICKPKWLKKETPSLPSGAW